MSPSARLSKLLIRTPLFIALYCSLSITLTFYNKWFIKDFHFPLTVTLFHLTIKFVLCGILRLFLSACSSRPRVTLSWDDFCRRVAPTGIASSFDIGLSNWSFQFITVSLYTMTKSTCIIFILGFSILFKLEKPKWSLAVIVVCIFTGLFMFTYKSTQFSLSGFLLVLGASFLGGLRWTLAQIVTQKRELGLSHPVDMVYHIQPWMALSLLPLVAAFEGERAMSSPALFGFRDPFLVLHYSSLMAFGAVLALAMELAEFLLLQSTSSLTLSISGVGKEILTLVLDSRLNGTRMTTLNTMGLCVCLNGIGLHVYHKWRSSSSSSSSPSAPTLRLGSDDDRDDENVDLDDNRSVSPGGNDRKWIEMAEIKSWERRKNYALDSGGGGGSRGGRGEGGGGGIDGSSNIPLLSGR